MVAGIESPERANESDGFAGGVELEAFVVFVKMDVANPGGNSRPTEVISGANRPQFWKIAGRIFGQSGFPTRRSERRDGESE